MRLLTALILALSLGACATLPRPVTEDSHNRWRQHQQQLLAFADWHLRGRIALFVDDDVYNLGLDWVHDQRQNLLTLQAALGQGMIRIRKLNNHSKLSTAEGETRRAPNAETLLRQTTGWDIPVDGLDYWIRGIPRPGSDAQPAIDADGRLLTLGQDGWQINYLEYAGASDSRPALPRKMYMKRGRVRIRIVIDQWQKTRSPAPDDLFPAFPD